jgi:hypothetical protein
MIIQIIPASGWYAYFKRPNSQEKFAEPLVCWALRELPVDGTVGTFREVTGINREGVACNDIENFIEYVYDPDAHNRVRTSFHAFASQLIVDDAKFDRK